MTSKEQIQDLIGRLEISDGPDRECDAEIHSIMNPEDKITLVRCNRTNELLFVEVEYPCGGKETDEISSYTSSIDTALTLVPDGYSLLMAINPEKTLINLNVGGIGNHDTKWLTLVSGKTTPIAICIAALRAME